MKQSRYILEKYKNPSTRYTCPACGKKKSFVRFVDTQTNKHVHETVGRCNRLINCGYYMSPKEYFAKNNITEPVVDRFQFRKMTTKIEISYIDSKLLNDTLCCYDQNNFVRFLLQKFKYEDVQRVINQYKIGTSRYWQGATVFWQIDKQHKIRTGKIILYDNNCHRVKKPFSHITWVHRAIKDDNFNLSQCLFGEHLIKEQSVIGIVESEKTAVICSLQMPNITWVATGGISNLSIKTCKSIKGHDVILYPDLNGFEIWEKKAIELKKIFKSISINYDITLIATNDDFSNGCDIADFIIKYINI